MDAPRLPEYRMNSGALETDGRTLAGYLSVFNSPTTINSYEGQFIERIKPGAFAKTVKERGAQGVKVMFDHGMGDFKLPIGKMQELREDRTGLYFEARLSDIPFNNETLIPLLQDEAIDGTSFRGVWMKDDWRAAKRGGLRERDVYEVALHEGGPVTWPAYQATTLGLRSAPDDSLMFERMVWQSLTEDQREEIAGIIRSATPLSTLDTEAGDATSDDRAATEDLEPQVQHSSNHLSRHAALAAMAKLKEFTK